MDFSYVKNTDFNLVIAMGAHADINFVPRYYNYTMPTPGLYVANSLAEYNAIVWTDTDYSEPSYSDLQAAFASWISYYPGQPANGQYMLDQYSQVQQPLEASVASLATTVAGHTTSIAALQPADPTLTALAAYNTNGVIVQTAPDTFVGRSLAAGTGMSVSNASGVSGNPTVAIAATGVTAASYGSSSLIPSIAVNAQGQITSASTVSMDKLYDHWHGTTQYTASQLRQYTNSATTDTNGRVTFNLTTNGLTTGGTALFSSILTAQATGSDGSGNPLQGIFMILESVSGSTYVFRAVRGLSTSIVLGGTATPLQYAGSGYTVNVHIIGAK